MAFLAREKKYRQLKTAKFVVVPCPHERTTSYGQGTKNGPKAIISASKYLEEFDEELLQVTYKKAGIHTIKPIPVTSLELRVASLLREKKIPIILGGEHSISPHAVKAAKEVYPDLSVLHFDAHADLDDSYQGSKESHACAARRMLEICPVVSIGVRNISEAGYKFLRKLKKQKLTKNVYISFDVDAFDPSIMPSTGTPEPGGMLWEEVIDIFRKICKEKKVVGADFVELAPIKRLHAPDFMVAKLIYKLMGYLS